VTLSIAFSGADDGDDGPFALAPNSVWTEFSAWADALPADQFAAVRALANEGEVTDTAALSEQLTAAVEQHPPQSEPLAYVVQELLENLGPGDSDETATVTDD
jgi:hypothetical protein